jgi:hypothetical protein
MVTERRKCPRVQTRIKAKARLRHSKATAYIVDFDGKGMCLYFPKAVKHPIPAVETMLIKTVSIKRSPCQVEAELKWNVQRSGSTIAGFELQSLPDSCDDALSAISGIILET